ncbi:hypothetical protein [Streptomyces sp. Ag109_G2-15]|uniref:hypothetical protein n=1 Tax=Streptomyces sp. Ag109_G2-15 TaxID=1938850 RepID=UPI000BE245D3|nr:hypothetical protein [Streptomyces sp. Ag109_G2-15]
MSCAASIVPLHLSAAPAYAADPAAPYAELTPDSGELVPGGDPLTVDATFHNTLDTDITDSFIVAVGIRLAPPAARLTSDQVTVEWFDAGPSVWRPVQLTPGDTALSGYLSTDAGLPSVGSLPAGDSARIPLRVSLASGVPAPSTLQFVTQGLIQPTASVDPAALMDGKASYSVIERTAAPAPDAASESLAQGSPASDTTAPTDTPSAVSSSAPPSATTPAPSALSDGTGGDGFADTGTSAPIVAGSVAALVFAAVVAVGVTWRRRRGRR